MSHNSAAPRLALIVGPMFSGKTTTLIAAAAAAHAAGSTVVVVKHSMDVRYGDGAAVTTHDGVSLAAGIRVAVAGALADVAVLADAERVVFVDEGHFFPDLSDQCRRWVDGGRDVTVAALSGDYSMRPLGKVAELAAQCDAVTYLTATCYCCGGIAPYSKRLTDDARVIVVGGSEMYAAACRRCHAAPPPAAPAAPLPAAPTVPLPATPAAPLPAAPAAPLPAAPAAPLPAAPAAPLTRRQARELNPPVVANQAMATDAANQYNERIRKCWELVRGLADRIKQGTASANVCSELAHQVSALRPATPDEYVVKATVDMLTAHRPPAVVASSLFAMCNSSLLLIAAPEYIVEALGLTGIVEFSAADDGRLTAAYAAEPVFDRDVVSSQRAPRRGRDRRDRDRRPPPPADAQFANYVLSGGRREYGPAFASARPHPAVPQARAAAAKPPTVKAPLVDASPAEAGQPLSFASVLKGIPVAPQLAPPAASVATPAAPQLSPETVDGDWADVPFD